jgi:hypothetical protein
MLASCSFQQTRLQQQQQQDKYSSLKPDATVQHCAGRAAAAAM